MGGALTAVRTNTPLRDCLTKPIPPPFSLVGSQCICSQSTVLLPEHPLKIIRRMLLSHHPINQVHMTQLSLPCHAPLLVLSTYLTLPGNPRATHLLIYGRGPGLIQWPRARVSDGGSGCVNHAPASHLRIRDKGEHCGLRGRPADRKLTRSVTWLPVYRLCRSHPTLG